MTPKERLLKDSDDDEGIINGDSAPSTALFGELRPKFKWDSQDMRLQLSVVQVAETAKRFDFKSKLLFDYTTGKHFEKFHLRKTFLTNVPSLQRLYLNSQQRISGHTLTEPNLNPESAVPCGLSTLLLKDWSFGPGLLYDSLNSRPGASVTGTPLPLQYTFTLNKNPQVILLNPHLDVVAHAKGLAAWNPARGEVEAGAKLRLSVSLYGVTSSQDARAVVGWDAAARREPTAAVSTAVTVRQGPYLKLQDKRFGVKFSGGRWGFNFLL